MPCIEMGGTKGGAYETSQHQHRKINQQGSCIDPARHACRRRNFRCLFEQVQGRRERDGAGECERASGRLEDGCVQRPAASAGECGKYLGDPVKIATPKQITYKSRDYGVSFVYPWQYSFITAKRIANDVDLQPKFDGDDGQFTLARMEIPKGFYPDTDFERGYFTLSLNQDISEEQCSSALGTGNDGKVKKETINGVEFEWVETEVSGGGSAAKLRDYVSFVNGACYEVELGVKTQNEQGLAREVDHDQVMRRLEGMLKTVNIVNAAEKPATQQVVSSVEKPTAEDQEQP